MTAVHHITHLSNLERIVQSGGIWCDFEYEKQNLRPVSIAYANLKARRSRTPVPDQGGFLADYVPFGLELLASVHWAVKHEHTDGRKLDVVVDAIQAWNERKRKVMQPMHIEKALHRLINMRWI